MRSGVVQQPPLCALACALALLAFHATAVAHAQDDTDADPYGDGSDAPADPAGTETKDTTAPLVPVEPSEEGDLAGETPALATDTSEQPADEVKVSKDGETVPPEEAPGEAAEDDTGASAEAEAEGETSETDADGEAAEADAAEEKLHWRKDPSLKRRPGSYLGGGFNYVNANVWVEETEDHDDLRFGPMHSWGINFRVGDAFTDWFALGFQILLSSARADHNQVSMFGLLFDISFYPWKGLGIRPAVGIGMGFAQGENKWDMGGGGPGCLSLAVLYEIRVGRLFSIAPMVQTTWIVSDGYDQINIFIGLEFMKWFRTATG